MCYCNLANLIQKVSTLLCKDIRGLSHMCFLFKVCGIKTLQILIFTTFRQIKTGCYQNKLPVDIKSPIFHTIMLVVHYHSG